MNFKNIWVLVVLFPGLVSAQQLTDQEIAEELSNVRVVVSNFNDQLQARDVLPLELGNISAFVAKPAKAPGSSTAVGSRGLGEIQGLINMGQTAYNILEKSSADISGTRWGQACALPNFGENNEKNWSQMTGWKTKTEELRVSFENRLFKNVVEVPLRIIADYNGSYQGVGHYLQAVSVLPGGSKGEPIDNPLFHELKLEVKYGDPENIHTIEQPVASIRVTVKYTLKFKFGGIVGKEIVGSFVRTIDGLGSVVAH